ncbi:hypothetical protein ACQP2U_43230 (plasmid) [Nocardia sp. CA-084685]|uniref:hypothetical protein n=1 Tax=Nocardia sp. CA-084685 TaxID=3239970 RepID=UPI003D981F74
MGVLKRLLLLMAALAIMATANAATASAQDRPDIPVPGPGPTLNLPTPSSDGNNNFQTDRNNCQDALSTGNAAVDGFIDVVTGGAPTSLCIGAATALNPGDAATTLASSAGSLFWGDPVGKFTRAVMEGNTNAFSMLMTFWMRTPIPALTDSSAAIGVQNITWEIQLIALAFGVGVGATRIAIARRHAVADGADETAKMLLRTVFAIWTLPALVVTLHQAGDSFSVWVIQLAAGGDVNAKINAITWINEKTGYGPVVSLALAGIGLLGSVAQLVALLIREAVLALAVGLSPIAAASSVTGTGRQTWSTMISYTVAALLFKPTASLLYAFAFWAAADQTAADAIVGAVLLAIAGLALPTLLRVIAPAVSTISAGGSQMTGLAAGGGAALGAAAGASKSAGGGLSGLGGKKSGGGSANSSAPAASGAKNPSYRGPYSGNGSSSRGGMSNKSAPTGGSSGGRMAAIGRGTTKTAGAALTGAGMALAGAAVIAHGLNRGISGTASFAEGAISNGNVPR